MHLTSSESRPRISRRSKRMGVIVACTSGCLLLTACSLTPLAKHTKDFAKSTATVVDGSKDAYRAAIQLRHEEQVTAAVYAYDKNPSWNPYDDSKPLLTPDQLQARITVLDGLKTYAASLVVLTGKPSKKDAAALQSAASGIGGGLMALDAQAATSLGTAIDKVPPMSAEVANGVSAAVLALGNFLIAREIKTSLKKITLEMNPSVQTLCKLLDHDAEILRRQADVDYQQLAIDQDQFIRHAGTGLNPIQHREEVGKLLEIAARQRSNDALLDKLQKAVRALGTAHQALTDTAQGKDQESLEKQIVELAAAGQELGEYYQSLPTK